MIQKKRKPRPRKPVITVRPVGNEWRAKCPCGRQFDDKASEKALSTAVAHGYRSHRWTNHEVKFR